ncbi:biotin/lipoyl-binding protein [Verrucomicrobium sp. BvORR034]|uniref:biotin/lipoyl-binding protein n=1 Tax=Verrucomicrobium sp. BvORR034 TaxID=1396418 RepID=UPI000679D2DE|nr:biotin/lipoyl-binding protein [Verrucomicrobium sp. BvORR034]
MSLIDHAVVTWDTARPRLRQDLQFHFQIVEGRAMYVVEDRANRSYHQLGVPEYRFLRSLNGTKPAAKLVAECSAGKNELTETEAESLLRWAIDHHLLQTTRSDQADRRLAHAEDHVPKSMMQQWQKFFSFKLPLGSPDSFLRPFTRALGWTLDPWAMVLALGVASYGGYLALSNYVELMEASSRAFLPQNWFWLLGVTVMLKLVHELWHGIATQKYGGVVPEWGVQVIAWISPMTYVDASSSWRFPSRWHRIKVAAAGMYVELLLAVTALHVWTITEPGLLRELCFNVLVSASMITLLFNANPLMRFDGYYIFSDLLDLRNLGQRGQQAFTWLNRRIFLGAKSASLPPVVRKRFFTYLTYGAASWCWRILVTIGLMALAAHMFHGMGLLPLLIAGVLGVAGLLHSLISFFKPTERTGHIPWATAWWRIGLAVLAVATALVFIQINPTSAGLAVVEYPGKSVVRAEVPGFVARQYVTDGQRVEKGQILVDLANEAEVTQLEMYHAQLALSETKARIFYLTERFEEWQTEQQKSTGLKEKLMVQQKRVRAMEVRAPISGRVHAPGLPQQRGSFFDTGHPLLTVIPDEAPEFLISMRQQDFQRIAPELTSAPRPFRIRLLGRPVEFRAELRRTETKATLAVPSQVLASSAGGPLAVRSISQRETATNKEGLARGADRSESVTYYDSIKPEAQRENMELLQPRFTLYASAREAADLKEGEWGRSFYEGETEEALGMYLYRAVRTYLEKAFLSPES